MGDTFGIDYDRTAVAFDETDPYDWWRTACEHRDWIGTERLPIYEGTPMLGYFRVRKKDQPWEPVAFFRDDDSGILQAERNGVPIVERNKVDDLWIWACRQPVLYEDWDAASKGKGWADEPERAPGIGDNIREADPHDALEIEWLGEKENSEEFLKTPIKTQAEADRAAIWAKRLTTLAGRADALHAVEKAPVLAEYRRVDDKWRDLQELPGALAKRLKHHQRAFLDEQAAIERRRVAAAEAEARRLREEAARKIAEAEAEQRRVAEEVARKAEEARRLSREGNYRESLEAQRASLAAAAQGNQLMAEAGKLVSDAKTAEAETAYRKPSAGRTGARVSMRTYASARIDDVDKLFASVRTREEVTTLLQTIADKAARAGVALPGCEIVKEERPV